MDPFQAVNFLYKKSAKTIQGAAESSVPFYMVLSVYVPMVLLAYMAIFLTLSACQELGRIQGAVTGFVSSHQGFPIGFTLTGVGRLDYLELRFEKERPFRRRYERKEMLAGPATVRFPERRVWLHGVR
jgi:hypothetical protein